MSEWQPIETAPKDWVPVLVWAISEDERAEADDEDREPEYCALVASHSDIQPGLWWMAGGVMAQVYRPTHWMSLPDAPAIAIEVRQGGDGGVGSIADESAVPQGIAMKLQDKLS